MKTLRQFSLKPVLIIILITPACTPSSDDLKTDNRLNGVTPIDKQNNVTIVVTGGTLKIDLYCDSDSNEAINFNRFNFSFGAKNKLTATDGTTTFNGTWSLTDTTGYIDNLSEIKFDISFTYPIHFVETINNWEIIDQSKGDVKLSDVIYGNGQTDFSIVSKN
ncbi:hypothetical protein [Flavobacterium sp. 83]|uniref:hypothetical protein n=1 Tax=Flavobacterium sp. 83 TaxID=1131812 RepID=UPI0005509490|nr:hypothetical protein [Flavobacterium sp. 83]